MVRTRKQTADDELKRLKELEETVDEQLEKLDKTDKQSKKVNEAMDTIDKMVKRYPALPQSQIYLKAKEENRAVTRDLVKQLFENSEAHQVQAPAKKRKIYKYVSLGPMDRTQTDVFFLKYKGRDKNGKGVDKYKAVLTFIDNYTRKLWYRFMADKSSGEIVKALRSIFEEIKNDKPEYGLPQNINGDQDFDAKEILDFFEENDVTPWISTTGEFQKNAMVERVHLTLRNFLRRWGNVNKRKGTHTEEAMNSVVESYNEARHGTTKQTPNSLWAGTELSNEEMEYGQENTEEQAFNIGDRVRHRETHNVFTKKSMANNWSSKVYEIERIEGASVYLKGLSKSWRAHELRLVKS